jgi:hypothetical protein
MKNVVVNLVTWGFALFGTWLTYQAIISFTSKMPVTTYLTLLAAIVGFSASYFGWKKRWSLVILLSVLIYVIGDLAAVFDAR